MRRCLVAAALLAAAAALPARASAQEPGGGSRGFVFGLGGGISSVRDARTDERGTGAMFNLRAGFRVGRGITPVVEVAGHRLFDELLPIGTAATSPVLKTAAMLASVQVELPRAFYVRPGVGWGNHAFVVPDSATTDEGLLYTAHESGSAAELAVGRTLVVARVVPIAIEGVALWTRGGDNSGNRLSVGVQLVALLRP